MRPDIVLPSSSVTFTVHGQITSTNAQKVPDGQGRFHKTKVAREDARRVREIALVAVVNQGWAQSVDDIAQAMAVDIMACNSRHDADNVCKALLDPLKGVVWRDDRDIMDLRIRRRWDREGERYVVTVSECADERPGRSNGAKKPRRITDGLPDSGLVTFEQLAAMKREGLV